MLKTLAVLVTLLTSIFCFADETHPKKAWPSNGRYVFENLAVTGDREWSESDGDAVKLSFFGNSTLSWDSQSFGQVTIKGQCLLMYMQTTNEAGEHKASPIKVTCRGNCQITLGDVKYQAHDVELNTETGNSLKLSGDVVVLLGDAKLTADALDVQPANARD